MTDYTPKQEWEAIDKFFKEVGNSAFRHVNLGMVFKEYVEESRHMGWDGFDSNDVRGIRRFLTDFIIYHNNRN